MDKKPKYNHSREAINITCESDALDIRIFINNILHFRLQKKDFVAMQSWYMTKYDCRIEIYTTTRDILLEYNSVEKWSKILSLLNENI